MEPRAEFDRIPENTIVIPGESLAERRHMTVPPHLRILIREPRQPRHVIGVHVGQKQRLQSAQPASRPAEGHLGALPTVDQRRAALILRPAAGQN